jgi:hypothetical protein
VVALVTGFLTLQPGFDSRLDHVDSVLDKVAFRQIFYNYCVLSFQFSFHELPNTD